MCCVRIEPYVILCGLNLASCADRLVFVRIESCAVRIESYLCGLNRVLVRIGSQTLCGLKPVLCTDCIACCACYPLTSVVVFRPSGSGGAAVPAFSDMRQAYLHLRSCVLNRCAGVRTAASVAVTTQNNHQNNRQRLYILLFVVSPRATS